MPVATARDALIAHLNALRRSHLWIEGFSGLIAGVSGGPDSLALVLIAADICAEQAVRFEAVVIDHGLREEAAAEARQVVAALTDRGIQARSLAVAAPPPSSGRPAWARHQRLKLLSDYARQTASAVLLAHHRGDQAETVAMRLMRGSGMTGLAAISAIRLYQGVVFGRPFLGLRKADLIAVCQAYKAGYITDPSNTDQAFERVRTRKWLQHPDLGLNHTALLRLAGLSSRLSVRLAEARAAWCGEHVTFTLRLRAEISHAAFSALNRDAKAVILRHCLAVIGAGPYPVAGRGLDRLLVRLAAGLPSTAGGCLLEEKTDRVRILAEFGRPPEPELAVQAGGLYRFDRRWLVCAPKAGIIRRLGAAGWAARNRFPAFQPPPGWTARMGAMIPVFHGLDGTLYCPHFKAYHVVCSAAGHIHADKGADKGSVFADKFCVSSLPVDGPLCL